MDRPSKEVTGWVAYGGGWGHGVGMSQTGAVGMAEKGRTSKTQRWLDLIAFLVRHRFPVDVDQVMNGVPAYRSKWNSGEVKDKQTVRRMFERDKDELRSAGIPLETRDYLIDGVEKAQGYELASRDGTLMVRPSVRTAVIPSSETDIDCIRATDISSGHLEVDRWVRGVGRVLRGVSRRGRRGEGLEERHSSLLQDPFEAAGGEGVDVEVEEQADVEVGQAEVGEDLGHVDGGELLRDLQLHDHLLLDQHVEPVAAVQADAAVDDRLRDLAPDAHTAVPQLLRQAHLVRLLQQPRPEDPVDLDGCPDDPPRQPARPVVPQVPAHVTASFDPFDSSSPSCHAVVRRLLTPRGIGMPGWDDLARPA